MENNHTLYTDTGVLTSEGAEIDIQVTDFMVPIFNCAKERGYDIRHLANLIINSIVCVECLYVQTTKEN